MKRMAKLQMNLVTTLFGAGLALIATSAFADTDKASAPHATIKTKAKTNWVTAPAKHNGSGVMLRYSVPTVLYAGQTATVQIRLSNVTKNDASVKVTPPANVTMTGDASVLTGKALPLGSTTLTLQVTPSTDGLEYLNVFTSQGGRATAQSIPLQVGSAKAEVKNKNKVETTPDGEKVISLPAAK